MRTYTTKRVAEILRIDRKTLYRYIGAGKISAPRSKIVGGFRIRVWTKAEIEKVRKQLPKIANGRRRKEKKKAKKSKK